MTDFRNFTVAHEAFINSSKDNLIGASKVATMLKNLQRFCDEYADWYNETWVGSYLPPMKFNSQKLIAMDERMTGWIYDGHKITAWMEQDSSNENYYWFHVKISKRGAGSVTLRVMAS